MIGEDCEISTNGEFCSFFSSKKYNNDKYLNILVKNFSIAVCDIGRSLSISDALECMFMNTVVGRVLSMSTSSVFDYCSWQSYCSVRNTDIWFFQ